ncbi:MAG: peptide chain release factor N(5)-glutamine methyltransferase [Flavobacteriaceae bacterium]
MNLNQLKILFREKLSSVFELSEIDAFFYRLVEYKLQLSKIDVVLKPDFELKSDDELYFKNALVDLQQEKPIQYIIGSTDFFGLNFKVTKATLIPRPETEELVDWILKDNSNKNKLTVLDVGTGSGCIPISLAKHMKQASVVSMDVSEEALEVATFNAKTHGVDVAFINDDILTYANTTAKYDVIVSNPPYVRHLEKQEIKKNVLAYEPHLALFVEDNDPLIFYKKITEFAVDNLTDNGVLYFEINQYLGQKTVDLVKSYGFSSVELRKDLSGNDRMLKASK